MSEKVLNDVIAGVSQTHVECHDPSLQTAVTESVNGAQNNKV